MPSATQRRAQLAAHQEIAGEIAVQHIGELIARGVERIAVQADAVIDHRAVEAAECLLRRCDQRRALRFVARIERHRDGASASRDNRARDLLAIRCGAPRYSNTSAGFGEARSQLRADTAAGTGDDVCAILEIEEWCSRHA